MSVPRITVFGGSGFIGRYVVERLADLGAVVIVAVRDPEAAKALRVLGQHPDGGEIAVFEGRYGPYIKWEKINATLPKDITPEDVALDQALQLIAEKAAKGGKKPAKAATAKKTAAQKTPAKKPAAKKAPAK